MILIINLSTKFSTPHWLLIIVKNVLSFIIKRTVVFSKMSCRFIHSRNRFDKE